MSTIASTIVSYLACVNVLAFAVFGIDKARSRRGAWRIPEWVLMLLAVAGGSLGAYLGMRVFHHKTRKPLFFVGVPVLLALSVAVAVGVACYVGDYYRADEVALTAVAGVDAAPDGVEVVELSATKVVFVPEDPVAGLVFFPGARVQPEAYAVLLRLCAQQRILCVLLKPALNLAVLDEDVADGAVERFPGVDEWMIAGHSLGGVAAADYASRHPGVFGAVVFLASYPLVDLADFNGQVLSVTGSEDGVLTRERYEDARAKLPEGSRELVIQGGNHAYFGNYGEQEGDGTATISRDEQQAQTVEAIEDLASRCS